VLRHDCPTAPVVNAGTDCFVYVVSGRQAVPVAGVRRIEARLRLWPAHDGGHWQVVNYDYDVLTRKPRSRLPDRRRLTPGEPGSAAASRRSPSCERPVQRGTALA
jgi:hypothetical protein